MFNSVPMRQVPLSTTQAKMFRAVSAVGISFADCEVKGGRVGTLFRPAKQPPCIFIPPYTLIVFGSPDNPPAARARAEEAAISFFDKLNRAASRPY